MPVELNIKNLSKLKIAELLNLGIEKGWNQDFTKELLPFLKNRNSVAFLKTLAMGESGTMELDQKQVPYCAGDGSIKTEDACNLAKSKGEIKEGWQESSAQGLFQFTDGTASDIKEKYGFDARALGVNGEWEQSLAALALIKERGGSKWASSLTTGNYSSLEKNLANTFMAIPNEKAGTNIDGEGSTRFGGNLNEWNKNIKQNQKLQYKKLEGKALDNSLMKELKEAGDTEGVAGLERYILTRDEINPRIEEITKSIKSVSPGGEQYSRWYNKNLHEGQTVYELTGVTSDAERQLSALEKYNKLSEEDKKTTSFPVYNKLFGTSSDSYETIKKRAEEEQRKAQMLLVPAYESLESLIEAETASSIKDLEDYISDGEVVAGQRKDEDGKMVNIIKPVSEILGDKRYALLDKTSLLKTSVNKFGRDESDYLKIKEKNKKIESAIDKQIKVLEGRTGVYTEQLLDGKESDEVGMTYVAKEGKNETEWFKGAGSRYGKRTPEMIEANKNKLASLIKAKDEIANTPYALSDDVIDEEGNYQGKTVTKSTWKGSKGGGGAKEIKTELDPLLATGSDINEVSSRVLGNYFSDGMSQIDSDLVIDQLDLPDRYEELYEAQVNKSNAAQQGLGATVPVSTSIIQQDKDEKQNPGAQQNASPYFSKEEFDKYLQETEEQRVKTGVSQLYENFGDGDYNSALAAAGMLAAMKSADAPLPQQEKSPEWKNYMFELNERRNRGLDAATLTYYQRNAERTYSHDVNAIARYGTSGQAVLASLGRAARDKNDAQLKLAALDEQAKASNFAAYGAGLLKDEGMTQSYWMRNSYNPADRTRTLKAALIGQLVTNTREDELYARQYGEGSFFANLMNAKIDDTRQETINKKLSTLKAANPKLSPQQLLEVAERGTPIQKTRYPSSPSDNVKRIMSGIGKGTSSLAKSINDSAGNIGGWTARKTEGMGSTLANKINTGVQNVSEGFKNLSNSFNKAVGDDDNISVSDTDFKMDDNIETLASQKLGNRPR